MICFAFYTLWTYKKVFNGNLWISNLDKVWRFCMKQGKIETSNIFKGMERGTSECLLRVLQMAGCFLAATMELSL